MCIFVSWIPRERYLFVASNLVIVGGYVQNEKETCWKIGITELLQSFHFFGLIATDGYKWIQLVQELEPTLTPEPV